LLKNRKIKYLIFGSTFFFCFFVNVFASSVVHLYIFLSPDCPTCELVKQENLLLLAQKIGCTIEPRYFDIDQFANYQKLIELEEKYKDTDNEIPVVFVGKYVLGGVKEIEANLEKVIKEYVGIGTEWPEDKKCEIVTQTTLAMTGAPKVYCGFFYQYTCKECQRIFYLLNYLEKKYPNLVIKKFNLKERQNKILYEAIAEKPNIPEKKRLIPATLFVGSDYLQQKEITLQNIENLLTKYEKTGSSCIWDIPKEDIKKAEWRIIKRFNSFGIATVSFAGLIDGINPCAFAVLVFFVSYLATIRKKGREILLVGFSFMSAVFLVYFLIGCGVFSFLSWFSSYTIFSRVLNILMGSGAIFLGILSFSDFLKARKGKTQDISLQLPKVIKTRIHSTIIKKMNLPNYIIGAFLAGIIVSFLEFACTGQVYLPTIVYITGNPGLKLKGTIYLLIYNLFFILPLFIILTFTYIGTTTQKLAEFSKKNVAPVKLFLSLFFLCLGILLIFLT